MAQSQDYDQSYYEGKQFANVGNFTYEDNKANSAFNFRITRSLMRGIGENVGHILDIGASGGFFVRYALEQGMDVYGQELSEWAVRNTCLRMRDMHRLTTRDLGYIRELHPAKFDVITSWFVFEHIEKEQLRTLLDDLLQHADFMVFRVPLLNIYETKEERAGYDPDPTHVNIWGIDEWRKFLWDNSDWYVLNAHFSDFGVPGGPGPVGTFLCTSREELFYGHSASQAAKGNLITEAFPSDLTSANVNTITKELSERSSTQSDTESNQ